MSARSDLTVAGKLLLALFAAVLLSMGLARGAQAEFGLTPGSFLADAYDQAGDPETQAGAHPYEARTTFEFNTVPSQTASGIAPDENVKTIEVDLPDGFIGNPSVVTECSRDAFNGVNVGYSKCPASSQIGTAALNLAHEFEIRNVPVFNVEPNPGDIADFGIPAFQATIHAVPKLRADGDYALQIKVTDVSQGAQLLDQSMTLWGVPASDVHNGERTCPFSSLYLVSEPWCEMPYSVSMPERPFLTNQTSCSGPVNTVIRVDSWVHPGVFDTASYQAAGTDNCEGLSFTSEIDVEPVQTGAPRTDSPAGLSAELRFDQGGLLDPVGLANAHLRRAEVTLPEGMTLNPAAVGGLVGCTDAQLRLGSESPVTCPNASKIGSAEAISPLLKEPLGGSIYLRTQGSGGPASGEMYRIALVLASEERGISIRLPGELRIDPQTGRITNVFQRNPQTPVEQLILRYRSGSKAALATPRTCGTQVVNASLTSWAGHTNTTARSFEIAQGPESAPACVTSLAQRPLGPQVTAGISNPKAGGSSPFTFRVTRPDGHQELAGLAVDLPRGLTAKLAGVSQCGDAVLASISAEPGTGAHELASPACPANSRVGSVTVGAGAGSAPYYVDTGKAYLAGPYKGAPLSLAVVVPVVTGPFDLGSVVVRNRLVVDPDDAQVHVVSDPLPQIIGGVPLRLRDVIVEVDRPDFMRAPTNCEPMAVGTTVLGASGASADLSTRFQVGDCGSLGFGPKLKLWLSGPMKRSGNPALKAVLTQPAGQANIGAVSVKLPTSQFIDNEHINNPCTRAQFAANACPAGSILGTATAWSPLLDKPLSGNVYFRANGGERELPDIVASLRGQISVDLVGFVDSVKVKGTEKSRVRNRFMLVPDAPVTRFEMKLKGGKVGLLENSKNLCSRKQLVTVQMDGQNGRVHDTTPVIKTSCPTKKQNKSR